MGGKKKRYENLKVEKVWVPPAKSKVSTFHWRLLDLHYLVSIEKQNLSLADSALQSITDTSEIPSIIYKGTLIPAECEYPVKFPKVPRGNMCNATQGCIQLVVEVKSLDNAGNPGGEACY